MTGRRKLVLIAAVGQNREIGVNGSMPWLIPSDLNRFKNQTTGHTVVMGRLTFESIIRTLGKPLPGRQTIVLTRGGYVYPGTTSVTSLGEALAEAERPDPVFVAGGAQVYELALPWADELWLTHVSGSFPAADAFFPDWTNYGWLVGVGESKSVAGDSHATDFRIWKRVP